MMPEVLALALIAILSGLSLVDTHLTFFAGIAWLWAGMTVLLDFNITFMLIALGVGMYFIFKGVWKYVPD